VAPYILKALYLLTDKERYDFLNQYPIERLPEMKIYFKKEELGFELKLLINQLEQQMLQYKETNKPYYSELLQMSQTIRAGFQHYQQNTEQDNKAAEDFGKICKTAAQKVNHKNEFPKDIKSILIGIFNVISALLVVGLPFVIQRYNQNNKSLFFTTPIERLTNKIEGNIANFSKAV
jgi:hypothetical protein